MLGESLREKLGAPLPPKKDGHVKILDFGVAKLLPSFESFGVDTETPTASDLGNGAGLVSPGLALLGRTDESIRILLRSVDAGVPPPYEFLILEPGFQPLKRDPRFAKVLAASRDEAAKIARVLEQARSHGELPKYLETPLDELLKLLKGKEAKS